MNGLGILLFSILYIILQRSHKKNSYTQYLPKCPSFYTSNPIPSHPIPSRLIYQSHTRSYINTLKICTLVEWTDSPSSSLRLKSHSLHHLLRPLSPQSTIRSTLSLFKSPSTSKSKSKPLTNPLIPRLLQHFSPPCPPPIPPPVPPRLPRLLEGKFDLRFDSVVPLAIGIRSRSRIPEGGFFDQFWTWVSSPCA